MSSYLFSASVRTVLCCRCSHPTNPYLALTRNLNFFTAATESMTPSSHIEIRKQRSKLVQAPGSWLRVTLDAPAGMAARFLRFYTTIGASDLVPVASAGPSHDHPACFRTRCPWMYPSNDVSSEPDTHRGE